MQFAIKPIRHHPSHLRHVATLPREIKKCRNVSLDAGHLRCQQVSITNSHNYVSAGYHSTYTEQLLLISSVPLQAISSASFPVVDFFLAALLCNIPCSLPSESILFHGVSVTFLLGYLVLGFHMHRHTSYR